MPKINVLDAMTIAVELLKAVLLALDNKETGTEIDTEALKIHKTAEQVLAELQAKAKK